MLGVVSRIRLVADVDVRSFELGFNKFGFEIEFRIHRADERSERFDVKDDADKSIQHPTMTTTSRSTPC